MWLAEVAGVRILFDPQLMDSYHAGLFHLWPERTVHAGALRADLIVVTHRHPDHFDVESLAILADLDPTVVVLTADAFVGETCKRLGFEHVAVLADWTVVPLDGARLLTTPSYCGVVEWGMIVASDAGTVWNQVDTELKSPEQIRADLVRAAELLEHPALAEGPDLALVRWQPLLQVHAVTGRRIGFPHLQYGKELDRVAALRARAIIPGAAGSFYRADEAMWLGGLSYPVRVERFMRDAAARCPDTEVLPPVVGARFDVSPAGVVADLAPENELVDLAPQADPRVFRPFAMPDLADPGTVDDLPAARDRVDRWVRSDLLAAVAADWPDGLGGRPVRCVLEVVWPHGKDVWTLIVGDSPTVEGGFDPDWDILNGVAGSALLAVLDARWPWGRALLGGVLRSTTRLYTVDATGFHVPKARPIFLYAAIGYDESQERYVETELARLRP